MKTNSEQTCNTSKYNEYMYLCYLVLFIFQNPGKSRKVQDGKSIIKAKYIKPIVFLIFPTPEKGFHESPGKPRKINTTSS